MKIILYIVLIFTAIRQASLQMCPTEVFKKGISVKWNESPRADYVVSDPLCYRNDTLITRNCTGSEWVPPLNATSPCMKVVKNFDNFLCPPGYHKILDKNNSHCYQIGPPSFWNFPCFTSGGASVITDLSRSEMNALIKSLNATNSSRYFWLPGRRPKPFNPLIWYVPGPNWGRYVQSNNYLRIQSSFLNNCLLLDTRRKLLITEMCNNIHPMLCFYVSDIHNPAKCPEGYYSFRFMSENGTCFGIEKADNDDGLTFDNFLEKKCKRPMSDDSYHALTRFIFTKIAEKKELPDDVWCWFKLPHNNYTDYVENVTNIRTSQLTWAEGAINNAGTLGVLNKSRTLSCMACETDVIYDNTELVFEYNEAENKLFLTIYSPSGLWKYNDNDKGIQCFSNAKGFVRTIDVNDTPVMEAEVREKYPSYGNVEKIVYVVNLVTDRSAQYWCEGHTKNFTLVTTDRLIVNPRGNEVHVFSLVIKYITVDELDDDPDISDLVYNVTEILNAQKVLFMDILEYTTNHLLIVLHVHVPLIKQADNESCDILETLNHLSEVIQLELPKYNSTLVNMSSALYCLPDKTNDFIVLDWELTPIGHITAPKQFCLQSNGLPVKRQCQGSFILGSIWGKVEGVCDTNYIPSETTTFLYNFVKEQVSTNYTTHFLTDGLSWVLSDLDIIIPADIYYLSMSLQRMLQTINDNETSVEIGDIENIAWVMDRLLVLDNEYLRLAQTLNSTNVILNTISDIIEIIVNINSNITQIKNDDDGKKGDTYQLVVKSKFIVQVSYPYLNNITGIAIHKNKANESFDEMIIKPLYMNTTMEEVLTITNLEIATWIPIDVLKKIKLSGNESHDEVINAEDIHIIITIYHNNVVFQELTNNNHVVNSRILGIAIPGYITNFENAVPLLFRDLNQTDYKRFCGYWEFQPSQFNQIPGFWKNQGCYLVKNVNNVTICECYHLTHFGNLLMIPGHTNNINNDLNVHHIKALNLITLVGSFLSLLGIALIWVSALVFENWRKKATTKVLLQLSTAIALPLILITVFSLDNSIFIEVNGTYLVAPHMKNICVALGALLHYSVLASFMWMLITSILQFVRYVRVLGVRRPSRFMIKFALIGWGTPAIPVIAILIISIENYIPNSLTNNKICYPNGMYAIVGIWIPVCVILAVNVILFLMILHSISRRPDEKMKETDMELVIAQLRLSIFLFFLMGLTWIFGIFSFTNNLLFSYLFCLTSTLQGFVLFIYFIICDPTTRNLWVTLVTPQIFHSSSRNSITSFSTT